MNTFIITAGGIGKRMNVNIPKQFLLLNNRPILVRTLERFFEADHEAEIILTLPQDWLQYWHNMLSEFECTVPHIVIDGGVERYHSIKNALKLASGDIICVHDGVRPFVSVDTIKQCITVAKQNGSAIPYLPMKDSVRMFEGDDSFALERSKIITVQTPQCFQRDILKEAYNQPYQPSFTDDASLVENQGVSIKLVAGNEENIKITTKTDLIIAELFA